MTFPKSSTSFWHRFPTSHKTPLHRYNGSSRLSENNAYLKTKSFQFYLLASELILVSCCSYRFSITLGLSWAAKSHLDILKFNAFYPSLGF